MYKDEKKASDLAKVIQPYNYVLVDTCSLMDEDFPEWMDVLERAKKYCKPRVPVYILKQCEDELIKHSKNDGDLDKRIAAERALHILGRHWLNKPIKILKEKNENFADNAIYVRVSTDRLHSKILVITQDKKLATDLLNLNELASQRGHRVAVFKIITNGDLIPNRGENRRPMNNSHEDKRLSSQANAPRNDNGAKKDIKKSDTTLDEIKNGDFRLRASLGNSNYLVNRKIKDIDAQLALLRNAGEALASLKLNYDIPALEAERAKLVAAPAKAVQKKEQPKVEQKDEAPKEAAPKAVETKKVEEPVASMVEEKKEEVAPATLLAPAAAPAKKLWYGFGHGLDYALEQVAAHYGVMFRDASVPYFAGVHGPIDATIADKKSILEELTSILEKEDVAIVAKKGYSFKAEKGKGGYRVYLAISSETPVVTISKPKSEPKPLPKKEEAPVEEKVEETKPAEKPVETLPEAKTELSPAPVEEDKPAKKKKKKAAKPESNPEGKPESKPEQAPNMATPQTLLVQRERDSVKAANVKANARRKSSKDQKSLQKASEPAITEVVGTATPQGATLVAMIPEPEMKDKIERSARFEAMKATKSAAKKDVAAAKPEPKKAKAKTKAKAKAKKEEAPVKVKEEKPTKKASAKKTSTKTAKAAKAEKPAKEEAPKTEEKKAPAKKAASKKKAEEKKPAKEKKAVAVDSALLAKTDKVLRANLANPNYKAENKVKDVNDMLELLKQASPEQKKGLFFTEDKLNQALKDIK